MIAEVIIDITNKQVNRSFDYHIPSHLENILSVGYRVYVPFGNLKRVGFVIAIKETTEFVKKIKDVEELIDVYPVLNEEFIDLAKFIAENNFSFYATALKTMIPSALKVKYQKIAVVKDEKKLSEKGKTIFKRKEINLSSLNSASQSIVFNEVKNGAVILDTKMHKRKDMNEISFVALNDTDVLALSKQGKAIVSYLEELNEPIELNLLLEDLGYSKSVIDTLQKKGIIAINKKEILPEMKIKYTENIKNLELNDDQKKAYQAIVLDKYKTYLLHGVTGSGKTEVYMRIIEDAVRRGKSSILLVPEISLTPQITYLFQSRFSSNIAILHSRLTTVEKYNEWKRIYNKDVKIVVGARSAIFAPLDNLGVIIVDECHESTYVQQNNPKYNAIEIATLRAKHHHCPLILGSATPNVVDYYYATNGEYELLTLPKRVNHRELPKINIVDLKEELLNGNKSVFSKALQKELIDCYKRKEQSIVFLNRRGYSSFVMCRSCGETVKCPHCDVSLTYHAYCQSLKCHYCGYTMPNVHRCYHCGSDKIRFVGSGTEKIVEATQQLLPEAKILRLDLDTVNRLSDYENAFYQFKNHEADILIGTQMITKGLDFDNVTLVGVVNADLAMSYPTHDATMVAYNLIEQVSGRAGRKNKEGKVILQTYNPKHYVIECVKNHDYEGFYKQEIQNRRLSLLPPFSTVIEVNVQSKNPDRAFQEAKLIIQNLEKVAKNSIILGPAESMIFKKKDIYSFTIQIQAVEDSVLEALKYIYPLYQNHKDINISITRMG